MNIPVVTVGADTDELVGGLERLHGPVTVVRRCAELPELLAACQSGLARAAVIAAGSGLLTATLVDRLAAVGVAVLVLTDDQAESSRLRGIGAAVAGRSIGAQTLAERIADAVSARGALPDRSGERARGRAAEAGRSAAPGLAAPATAIPAGGGVPPESFPAGSEGANPGGGVPTGRILAVWGPAGAPGRTVVAVNIAAELAAAGQSVLLIDADSYGASIAASLGLLDESAGLAQACRLADQGVLTCESLRRVAADVVFKGGRMLVLTGLTRADRWPELRRAPLELVLDMCRSVAQATVIDCGFCLETDEELSYDSVAPRRNAATVASLTAADSIIAVGSADAIGMPRLVRGLAELAGAVPGAEVTVALNKVRRGAAGRGPERALRLAWERFGPPRRISHVLPWDPDATDRALLAGQLLLEAAPESGLRHAVASMVCAPDQRRRKTAVSTATAIGLFSR